MKPRVIFGDESQCPHLRVEQRVILRGSGFPHAILDEGQDAAVLRRHVDPAGLTEHRGVVGVPTYSLEKSYRVESPDVLSVVTVDVLSVFAIEECER